MALIELQNINKIFHGGEDTVALRDVNVTINEGEFVAIMGPSGSGKSTLMNIIGLLDDPSSGSYLLEGKDVSRLKDKAQAQVRRQKIGFIFQSFNLIPRLSLQQNVELPLVYEKFKPAKRHARATTLLKKVGLGDRAKYRPNQISGGQLQRAAIARALVNHPSLILADEPTGNLDSKSGQAIMQLLTDLNRAGTTVILVTHDQNIARFAKRIIRVMDGKVTEEAK